MITEQEEELERIANIQIKAMKQVFKELFVESGIGDCPKGYYWFRYVDYAEVDRYGNLECYTRGYGNDPNSNSNYVLEVDDQLLKDSNVDSFKIRFRNKLLPVYNEMRKNKLASVLYQIESLKVDISKFEGDIV